MTAQPEKIPDHPSLPILTQVADTTLPEIPTLTEIHDASDTAAVQRAEAKVEPLSAAACDYLVAQIAPQIDALLQIAILDIQARLPELIRSALDKQQTTPHD